MRKSKRTNSLILNGQQSSMLALLAMSVPFDNTNKKRILSILKNENDKAYRIALCILGFKNEKDKSIVDAANGFVEWANGLKEINYANNTPK